MFETSSDKSLKRGRRALNRAARTTKALSQDLKTPLSLVCRHEHPPHQNGRVHHLASPSLLHTQLNLPTTESFNLHLSVRPLPASDPATILIADTRSMAQAV